MFFHLAHYGIREFIAITKEKSFFSRKMLLYLVLAFFAIRSCQGINNETSICARSYNSENRSVEVVNCSLPVLNVRVLLTCHTIIQLRMANGKVHDSVRAHLSINKPSNHQTRQINTTSFHWYASMKHHPAHLV